MRLHLLQIAMESQDGADERGEVSAHEKARDKKAHSLHASIIRKKENATPQMTD